MASIEAALEKVMLKLLKDIAHNTGPVAIYCKGLMRKSIQVLTCG